MTANQPGRIVAGTVLLAGGFVVAVSALAIATAKVLVDQGVAVNASDAGLLDDLSRRGRRQDQRVVGHIDRRQAVGV